MAKKKYRHTCADGRYTSVHGGRVWCSWCNDWAAVKPSEGAAPVGSSNELGSSFDNGFAEVDEVGYAPTVYGPPEESLAEWTLRKSREARHESERQAFLDDPGISGHVP